MKKRQVFVFGLFALSVTAFASPPAVADVITLRADEWCPYNCAPDSKQPGFMIEMAKRIFEPAGHQVDYQLLNWARAIEDTRTGKYVAIVGAARGDAEDFVFPSESLGTGQSMFAVRKGDAWTYSGPASLKTRSLGVIRDYSYSEALDEYIENNKNDSQRIQVASGDNALEINLRKLQKGRVDTVVESDYVLRYTLAQLDLANEMHVVSSKERADPLYIAFSPAHPKAKEYAQLLSQGIAKLRASGELQGILKKYGVSDWK